MLPVDAERRILLEAPRSMMSFADLLLRALTLCLTLAFTSQATGMADALAGCAVSCPGDLANRSEGRDDRLDGQAPRADDRADDGTDDGADDCADHCGPTCAACLCGGGQRIVDVHVFRATAPAPLLVVTGPAVWTEGAMPMGPGPAGILHVPRRA